MGYKSSARLTELHVLVRAEESHKLWHLDDLNESGLVDVEVSPCLLEVGVHVVIEEFSSESLVGSEDLLGGGVGGGLVHPELSRWLTSDGKTVVELLNWGLLLESVVGDHGSHEDVIGIGGESWGDGSLVVGGFVVEDGEVVFLDLDGGGEADEGSNDEFHSSLNV